MDTDIIFFIGRILLGGFLLLNAYNHFSGVKGLTAYAESKKVPFAKWAVIGSGILLLFGGYTILAGVRVTAGVAALVLFFLPVTFTMHPFWKEEGEARATQMIQFTKNLAILGGILALLAIETPWPLSVGNW